MGVLSVAQGKGKEVFSFEYSADWLRSGFTQVLDPDLQLYSGAYYPRDEKVNFGVFLDSCPDRWGRVLMQRREAAMARMEGRTARELLESDYLLGVFDGYRMGAACFSIFPTFNQVNTLSNRPKNRPNYGVADQAHFQGK